MSEARAAILRAIRGAGVAPAPPVARAATPATTLATTMAPDPVAGLAALLAARLGEASTSSDAVPDWRDVPMAVADRLRTWGLPCRAILGEDVQDRCAWPPDLGGWARGEVAPDGDAFVSRAVAAVAGEGVVVTASSARHRTEQAFLAESHLVVVEAGDIVADLASLWTRLRASMDGERWPRSVNLIRGPSRTADLGVPSRLGAHGPARMHVIVVGATLVRNR